MVNQSCAAVYAHQLTVRALAVFLLALCISSPVIAEEPVPIPSPELSCLTRTPGSANKPEYPDEKLELRVGTSVPVSLVFTRPDKGPDVVVVDTYRFHDDFVDAIKSYARDFRVPCMAADRKPVTLQQEYHFDPFDGRKVISSPLTDVADAKKKAILACLSQPNNKGKLSYPKAALSAEEQGKYYVELTFSAPDQGPSIKWIAESPSTSLKSAIVRYVADMRVPCLGDEPIAATMTFDFMIDGAEQIVIKDMSLKQFIMTSKDVQSPVSFNMSNMDCPFDVRVTYLRPFAKNRVEEIETTNPVRKPLLDWLSLFTFAMPNSQNLKVLSEQFNVSIPCGSVNL